MLNRNNEMISPEIYLVLMMQTMKFAMEYQEQAERYSKEVKKANTSSYRNHSRLFKNQRNQKNYVKMHQPQTGKYRRHI